jgi:hypothetical protein
MKEFEVTKAMKEFEFEKISTCLHCGNTAFVGKLTICESCLQAARDSWTKEEREEEDDKRS